MNTVRGLHRPQNTVTVEVPYDERDNVIEEAESRNGRVERE
jgi:hypothetical protein